MAHAMKKGKPSKMKVVREYSSRLAGEQNRLCLCEKDGEYGVMMTAGNIISSPDYKNGSMHELRTFAGNEEAVIDWVAFSVANKRYAELILQLIYSRDGITPSIPQRARPILHLVKSD